MEPGHRYFPWPPPAQAPAGGCCSAAITRRQPEEFLRIRALPGPLSIGPPLADLPFGPIKRQRQLLATDYSPHRSQPAWREGRSVGSGAREPRGPWGAWSQAASRRGSPDRQAGTGAVPGSAPARPGRSFLPGPWAGQPGTAGPTAFGAAPLPPAAAPRLGTRLASVFQRSGRRARGLWRRPLPPGGRAVHKAPLRAARAPAPEPALRSAPLRSGSPGAALASRLGSPAGSGLGLRGSGSGRAAFRSRAILRLGSPRPCGLGVSLVSSA